MADVKVVAPMNMGLGLIWNSPTKRYDVAFGTKQPFKYNSNGEIEFKISADKGNLIRLGSDNGIYYGIEAKANVANLYVDAENGVDQNPNDVQGAGTREKPLRTLKYAMDLADPYTNRYIYLHEEQEHIIPAKNKIFMKEGSLTITPYGPKFDKSQDGSRPEVVDLYQARIYAIKDGIAPKIKFTGVRETLFPQPTAPTRWNIYAYDCIYVGKDCSLTIAGVGLINDVTSVINNTNADPEYSVISLHGRILNAAGNISLDGSSFERRGSVTVKNVTPLAKNLGMKNHVDLWETGMFSIVGTFASSLSLRQIHYSENYEEHIISNFGWQAGVTNLNNVSIRHVNHEWAAKRIYGVQKEVQNSGDVLVLAPNVDVPNKLFA